jgi:Helical and beta-bridge domain
MQTCVQPAGSVELQVHQQLLLPTLTYIPAEFQHLCACTRRTIVSKCLTSPCRAEHFVLFLRRLVDYLKKRVGTQTVVSQSSSSFLEDVSRAVAIDGKTLRFCYDRLGSLMKTLEIHNTDDYLPIQLVADFGTLIGTYEKGAPRYISVQLLR